MPMSASKGIAASAIHLDTVQIGHAYKVSDLPPPDELSRRGFEISFKERESSGDIIIGRFRPLSKQSHEPRLTVIRSEQGYCGIKAELSIAKLLDGSGLGSQTDEDIECALDAIEGSIRQRTGVDFNSRTAKVKRLDVNADFPVGEHRVRPYVRAISCRSARMTRGTVGDTTTQFHNRSRKLVVYGKLAEVRKQYCSRAASREDVEAARGLLRVESRLMAAPLIRLAGKFDVPADAGHLLTMGVAHRIMVEAIAELNLDRPKPSNQHRAQLLLQHFGKDAPSMLGILEWRALHGEGFWREIGWSQATYYRNRKRLQTANLWDFSPAGELPALLLPADANNNYTTPSDLRIGTAPASRIAA